MNPALLKQIYKPDMMENAASFSNKLSNAQVIKFFQRQGAAFTKTMIQNYIRVKLLPRPNDGRFYGKEHLYMLAMVAHLKTVYSIDELRALFLIIMKDTETFDGMALSMKEAYAIFISLYNNLFEELITGERQAETPLAYITERGDSAARFAFVLDCMVRSAVYRQLAAAELLR